MCVYLLGTTETTENPKKSRELLKTYNDETNIS